MPAKHSVKTYIEDSYYHVYNRGVEKRNIFRDDYDYRVFMNLLKIYLSPLPDAINEMEKIFPTKKIRIKKTFHDEIDIISLCLMPNHFHLLLHQNSSKSITEFMRAVCTSYSMYFNKKYSRVGSLFQSIFKAVYVSKDEYLLHLSRYIHRNPLKLTGFNPVKLGEYPYSSFSTYLNPAQRPWINTQFIYDYFTSGSPALAYKEFVEMIEDEKPELLNLVIEDD